MAIEFIMKEMDGVDLMVVCVMHVELFGYLII